MAELKVGRNDPCPCGSGKKYKKCCGRREEYEESSMDAFSRYNSLMTTVKLKLDQTYGQEIKRARRELQQHFLRFAVKGRVPREHDSIFSDWMWFDQVSEGGQTIGCAYLSDNGSFLDAALRESLAALNASFLSVYEVVASRDAQLELHDIVLDQDCTVLLKEHWEVDLTESGKLLLGRVVQMAGHNLFSGMVLMLEDHGEQKQFLQDYLRYAAAVQPVSARDLLKFHAEITYGLFYHALKQQPLLLNHIEAAAVPPLEYPLIQEALGKEYGFIHRTAGLNWYQPLTESAGYCRLALGEGHIIAIADTLPDHLKLMDFIQKWFPAVDLILLGDRFRDELPPLEMASLFFTVLKDRETESWLDTPHQELRGRTPRNVLSEDQGREKLMSMLDEMAAGVANEEGRELLEYMKLRINQPQ